MRAVSNQDLLISSVQTPFLTTPASSPSADNAELKFKESDWVLIKYDKRTYPGIVTAVVGSDIEFLAMEMAGSKGKL